MSKKRYKIYANTGVTYAGKFYPAKSTFEVSEDLFKDLQETRFFRHNILVDITKNEKVQEEKTEEEITE